MNKELIDSIKNFNLKLTKIEVAYETAPEVAKNPENN
jgi:hypothetical protein